MRAYLQAQKGYQIVAFDVVRVVFRALKQLIGMILYCPVCHLAHNTGKFDGRRFGHVFKNCYLLCVVETPFLKGNDDTMLGVCQHPAK